MLQPKRREQLDANIKELLANGGSNEEIELLARDFTAKFGNEVPVKKKDASEPISPKQKSVSGTKVGSSDGVEKISKDFKMFPDGVKTTTPKQPLPKINKTLQEAINKPENVAKRKEFQRQEVMKWREATKLNEQERIESENDLKSKKEQEGVWNNVKAIGKDVVNKASEFVFSMTDEQTTPKELILEKDPLFDEKKQAKIQLREQGVKNIKSEDVNSLADKIYLDKTNLEKKQQKINDYLGSVDSKTKSALKIDAEDRFTTLSKKKKDITNRISLNEKYFQELQDDLENPNITQEDKLFAQSEIQKVGKYLKEDYKAFTKQDNTDLGTAKDEFNAFKRNYNALENFGARASLSLANAGVDLYSGANYIANTYLGAKEEYKQEGIQKAREFLQKKKEDFRPDSEDVSFKNFFQYSTDLLANQAGTFAQIGAGGIGIGALGLEASGSKYSEMTQSNKSGKTNYTPQQMALAPFVSGLSEAIFSELPTIKTLRGSANIWKSAMKEATSKELAETAIKNTSESIAKNIVRDTKKEVSTELINNVVQNVVKKDIQGEENVGYFDNSIKTLKDTALLTGMIGSVGAMPHVALSAVKSFSDKAESRQLDANAKKITALLDKLEDVNISETTKKVVKEQIDLATKESSSIINKTIDKLGKMPLNQIEIVYNNSKRLSELQRESIEIKDDTELDDASKKILLQGLKSEYLDLQNTNTNIINGNTSPVESLPLKEQDKIKREASNQLIQELNPDGTKNIKIDNEQITERANKIYLKQQKDAEIESANAEAKSKVEPKAEVQEPTNSEQKEITPIQKLENDYNEKSVDELVKIKKDLYSNPDIESAMSEEEKILNKVIAEKYSNINSEIKAKRDEAKQKGDIVPNGDVSIGDNADLQQQQVEAVQPSATIGEGKTDVEVKKYKVSEKGQAFNVENKNGRLEVTNSKGEVVSKPTERAVLRKHADNTDLTIGERAIDNPDFEQQDWENEVAKKSNNPAEIAEAIHYAEIEDVSSMNDEEKVDYKKQIIADGLSPIKESGFDRFGDKNNKTNKTKSYFDNESGREIDDLAQELSEIGGVEITPNDIADFISENPDGLKSYKAKAKDNLTEEQIKKSNAITALKEKFTSLTGLNASNEFLLKAIEQKNRKDAGFGFFDQMTDNELIEYYEDYKEFEKQQYGNKETEQISKRIDDKQTITTSEKSRKERVAERKQAVNVNIDELANALKDLLPKTPEHTKGSKKQGLSQDDLIDFVANSAKQLIGAGIEVQEAIRQVISHLNKKGYDFDFTEKEVAEKHFKTLEEPKETKKEEVVKKKPISDSQSTKLRDKIKAIPESGVINKYLSGETIEREYGTPTNAQEYDVKGDDLLRQHGIDIVNDAKEKFGDKYVEELLDFIEASDLNGLEKGIILATLENEMDIRVKNDPTNVGEKKLQEFVTARSQENLRIGSLTIRTGRLRALNNAIRLGIDIETYRNDLYTSKQQEAKSEVEKIVETSIDKMNEEDDIRDGFIKSDKEIQKLIDEGVQKEIDNYYKSLSETRRKKADKILNSLSKLKSTLRSNTYDATSGIPIAIIDAGITTIENAIKGGLNIADALDKGVKKIKELYGKEWSNESKFRKDITDHFKKEGFVTDEKPIDTSVKSIVKQALIDAGFYREVTYKGEKVKRFDWKKLAGKKGIEQTIIDTLKEQGKYSDKEIESMTADIIEEFKELSASVIEKGIKELERKGLIKERVYRKAESKTLAELYNFGLFENNEGKYSEVLNKVIGLSSLKQESFVKLEKLVRALSELYNYKDPNGKPLSKVAMESQASQISHNIKKLISEVSTISGGKGFRLISLFKDYQGLSLKAMLGGIATLLENYTSGKLQMLYQKIQASGKVTPELRKQIQKDKDAVYNDIVKQVGLFYGETGSSLISHTRFEDWLNGKVDSEIANIVVSVVTLRAFLEAQDSQTKASLTSSIFIENIIDTLTLPLEKNPNGGMTKDEAQQYLNEQLTGDIFEKALVTAKSIIDEINSQQEGEKVLKDNKDAIHRFAMGLVKQNLASDGRMTMEQIEQAFDASYKSAGLSIGHEANNMVTKGVNLINAMISHETEKAIKEEQYGKASFWIILGTGYKGIIAPFLGGGSNWVVLQSEKVGVPLNLVYNLMVGKGNELDLSTVSGRNNYKESLYRRRNTQASAMRTLSGLMISGTLAMALTTNGDDEEDAIDKLRVWSEKEENKWAKKYIKKMTPTFVTYLMTEKDDLGKFFVDQFGMKVDYQDNILKTVKAIGDGEKFSTESGKLLGSSLSAPFSWRALRDVYDLNVGLQGREPVYYSKPEGFGQAFMDKGFIKTAKAINDNWKGDLTLKLKDEEKEALKKVEKKQKERMEKGLTPIEEKEREGKIKAIKTLITQMNDFKYLIEQNKKGLPYYFPDGSKLDFKDVDTTEIRKGVLEMKKTIELQKKEFGIKESDLK
jgi:hypothetical protein